MFSFVFPFNCERPPRVVNRSGRYSRFFRYPPSFQNRTLYASTLKHNTETCLNSRKSFYFGFFFFTPLFKSRLSSVYITYIHDSAARTHNNYRVVGFFLFFFFLNNIRAQKRRNRNVKRTGTAPSIIPTTRRFYCNVVVLKKHRFFFSQFFYYNSRRFLSTFAEFQILSRI